MTQKEFPEIREGSSISDAIRGAYLGNERIYYFNNFEDGAGQIDTISWAIPGKRIENKMYIVGIKNKQITRIGEGRILSDIEWGNFFDEKKSILEGNF